MKSRDGKSQRREEKKKEDQKRESLRRNKMQVREKVGKSRNTVFFQSEGRKVGALKRRVRSQLARWEMKNCTPLWREAHFQLKMYKAPQPRSTFGSWDVEKVHTVVAQSTFRSQNVQSTARSDRFWKLRCRKSARRCGAKHISKSKVSKKMTGSEHFWTFRRSDVVLRGRRKGLCTLSRMSKTWGFCSIFNYNHPLHNTTLHYTTLHYTPLHSITLHYNTLHYTTLHSTPLHYTTTTLRYTTLHNTTFHHTTLHYTTLHSNTLHYTTLNYYTTLHYTTLHYTTLNYTTLNYTTFHYTTLHYINYKYSYNYN